MLSTTGYNSQEQTTAAVVTMIVDWALEKESSLQSRQNVISYSVCLHTVGPFPETLWHMHRLVVKILSVHGKMYI